MMTKDPSTNSGNRFAFATVTVLFFMWGFITCMNDILTPKFKADFDLSQTQANLVQFAFFGAYFLVSLFYFLISASTGDPINKIGYKNGLVLGLVVAGLGCLTFYPAAEIHQFWLFLTALAILGAGVTIIQIAANPYVTILGPEKSGPSRLNLAQGFCSLGYVIAPFIGGIMIFGTQVFDSQKIEPAKSTETIGYVQTILQDARTSSTSSPAMEEAVEETQKILDKGKKDGLNMEMAGDLRKMAAGIVEDQAAAGEVAPTTQSALDKMNGVIRPLQLAELDSLKAPYVGLGIAFLVIAVVFKMISLPAFTHEGKIEPGITAFKHKHFVWGWLAIFFYVGSEVTIGNILVNYLGDKSVMGLSESEATKYLSFCWGGLMIGRLMGGISLGTMKESKKMAYMILAAVVSTAIIYACATLKEKFTTGNHIDPVEILPFIGLIVLSFIFFELGKSSAGRMVGLFALVAAGLTVFSMSTSGNYALWSILGIGLFNSIMWSNIFSLSIKGLGKDTSQGSSLLVMMIVGGAIMPLGQGWLMDNYGIRESLGIVLIGYLYLIFYGFFAPKAKFTVDESCPVPGGH